MKKRVEAELISIAHRILKLKNKSEVDQLYKETQKLYEALTILKFYGDNYEMVKQTVSKEDLEEKLTAFIEEKEAVPAVVEVEKQVEFFEELIPAKEAVEEAIAETTENEEAEEETVVVGEVVVEEEEDAVEDESFEDNDAEEATEIEDLTGETADEDSFMPSFELSFEEEQTAMEEQKAEEDKKEEKASPSKKMTMDEVMGDHFKEPEFVKPEDNVQTKFVNVFEDNKKQDEEKAKVLSLNDALSNTISIGLNDRIGFVKHLFNESNEDYNRVLSQLNTFDTFSEAKEFLNEMVIPDYNYWVGKEEYLERFMEAIEKKFK
jgi:hypothetical protein